MTAKATVAPVSGSSSLPVVPNALRNSGFWFCQWSNPTAATSVGGSTRSVSADGWGLSIQTTAGQYQRVDTSTSPESGFLDRYYGKFIKATGAGKIVITQALESVDCQHLRGKTVRFQVWLKASASVTWRMGVVQLTSAGTVDSIAGRTGAGTAWVSTWNSTSTDPTLNTSGNLAYITPDSTNLDNCTVVGSGLNCSVTTSWQRFGGTFTVPTNCKNIIVQIWSDDSMAVSDYVCIGMASLTSGTDIVGWGPYSMAHELLRCQRFLYKTFPLDTPPATTQGYPGSMFAIVGKGGSKNGTTNGITFVERFPVPVAIANLTDTNGSTGYRQNGVYAGWDPNAPTDLGGGVFAAGPYDVTASLVCQNGSTFSTIAGANALYAVWNTSQGMAVGDEARAHLTVQSEI